MKQLWAPWRLAYIQRAHPEGCIFCRAVAGADDRAALVVHRRPRTFVIMNLFPYNSGHVMVVPNRHVSRPSDLDDAERLDLMQSTVLSLRAQEGVFHPEGSNVGMNLGRAAGAGIDDHLHIHVVPRWVGDTNFMPVLGDVKVIPEHLEATYDRLVEAFAELARAG
jgi:ATP adenylyltransferase